MLIYNLMFSMFMMNKAEFESRENLPHYLILYKFLKNNKNKAYTIQELYEIMNGHVSKKTVMLHIGLWKKAGLLQHVRPYYRISEKGLNSGGLEIYVIRKRRI